MLIFAIFFAFFSVCIAQTTTLTETTTVIETTQGSSNNDEYHAVFPEGLEVTGTIKFFSASGGGLAWSASLQHSDANNGATGGFNWHIHNGYTSGDSGSGSQCGPASNTAMGHYDPENRENTGTYNCDQNDFSTCYKGDMSGKFGSFTFPVNSGNQIDNSLSMNDITSNQLSVVIHDNTSPTNPPRLVCASIKSENAARGDDVDGMNFVAAEASGGTVFLMTLVYIIGFCFGIIAIWQIGNAPPKESDKKLKRRLSKLGKIPSTPVFKKWGVAPPPKRAPSQKPQPSRDERFFSTDTTTTVPTSMNPITDFAPPPADRPPPSRPLPPPITASTPPEKSPALPPRPPSTNPFNRDPAPSTVSSIGGLPPIPTGPPKDNIGDFDLVDIPEKPEITMEDKMNEGGGELEDSGYVDIQVKDELQDVTLG